MNEKEFMKEILSLNMPDVLEVKQECIEQLNTDKAKEKNYRAVIFTFAAISAVFVMCFCVTPLNSFAKNIIKQITVKLDLNDNELELGEADEFTVKIPDDCESVVYEGVTYMTKSYNSLSDLCDDIGTDFYIWTGSDKFIDEGIILNAVENDYGRITLLYDVTGQMITDSSNDGELRSVNMIIYFPLSQETNLGDLVLKNEQMSYSTVDDGGNVLKYEQNTEYELVEQYDSKALDTVVTVIASTADTKITDELEEFKEADTMYYLYFTLDGICYQVTCAGTLDNAYEVIENMGKVNSGAIKNVDVSGNQIDSSDLLYRDVQGETISLECGETINLSVENDEEFNEVFIIKIGENAGEYIGTLNKNISYSFTVETSGKYIIYSAAESMNIIDRLVIGHSYSTAKDNLIWVN